MENIKRMLLEKIGMKTGEVRGNRIEVLSREKIYDFLDKMTEVQGSYIVLPKEIYFIEEDGKLWLKVEKTGDMEWDIRRW
jgi:hypothetical protein